MKIFDLAAVVRSKNAGPLWLTIDLMFDSEAAMETLLQAPEFTRETVAGLYHVSPTDVSIIPFPVANSVKITLPRPVISGATKDDDIYGCQQHMPVAGLEITT